MIRDMVMGYLTGQIKFAMTDNGKRIRGKAKGC
jgi:hypothetical protein